METLSDVARRYEFNAGILAALTRDFSEGDWDLREDDLNAAHWILAHLVGARRSVLRMLGQEVSTEPWEKLTGMGGPRDGFKSAPEVSDLVAEFRAQGARIKDGLRGLSSEAASRPLKSGLPDGSKTVIEGVSGFFYFHETFHLGQLDLIRRLLGKPGIA
jgi:hypothetical protein